MPTLDEAKYPNSRGSGSTVKETLAESIPLVEATRGQQRTGERMRIKLISPGWGSSGHYNEAVLRKAADDQIWPSGTHMYLDHPTASEGVERPERSVRDLAAVLTTPATYEHGALHAEARVFGPYQQLLTDMAEHIGVSIRAAGIAEHGEAEGREGIIITELTEGISVDFVTRAGRGGQIVEVLEAARHEMALSEDAPAIRDERITLPPDFKALEWARSQVDVPYQPGTPTSAPVAETITPAPPALPNTNGAPMGDPTGTSPSGGAPTDVSEAATLRTELAETKQRLAEAELEIAKLGDQSRELEEAKRDLAESKRENLRLRANDAARDKAIESLKESTLPKVAHAKVIASVTGPNVPLNEDGALDEAALVKNIKAAIQEQRDYLTAFAEESGMGQVRGLGGSAEPQVDTEKELGEVFASLGMTESAASAAAKGR
ncbi:hypothetical protein [Actinomadura rugatobispora]|uniref:DUF2213 domain-containing protein n=1 Tax=Actinomadura rugatobispora TaxID=1994 RepID=A0ABW0ZNG7_9ACTN|nr:hypothetical protein GCM10010200_036370 [Actinomadura rugatobispora]